MITEKRQKNVYISLWRPLKVLVLMIVVRLQELQFTPNSAALLCLSHRTLAIAFLISVCN